MAINEDQIRKLIEDYEGYQEECLGSRTAKGIARADLYGAVLNDLKALLPRKTLKDVVGDDLQSYEGTWVEFGGRNALVLLRAGSRVMVVIPTLREYHWVETDRVYPLGIRRVWDEDGDLVY